MARGSGPFVCPSELSHYGRRQNSWCGGQRCRWRVAMAATKRHTINFAQTNWIAFVARAKTRDDGGARAAGCRSLSVIAQVALISSTEERQTIKYRRTHNIRAPWFNPRHSCAVQLLYRWTLVAIFHSIPKRRHDIAKILTYHKHVQLFTMFSIHWPFTYAKKSYNYVLYIVF